MKGTCITPTLTTIVSTFQERYLIVAKQQSPSVDKPKLDVDHNITITNYVLMHNIKRYIASHSS